MRIICHNHQEIQSIGDILRLYFDQPEFFDEASSLPDLLNGQDGTALIIIKDDSPLNTAYTIHVAVDQTVTLAQIRNPDDQTAIKITSYVEATTLRIETVVIPSDLRREIKRQVYYLLSRLLGIEYPWGSLTGIRPTQIAYRCYIKNNGNFLAAKNDLVQNWFVSSEKADIALDTAIAEMKIIEHCDKSSPMLYIGIPFCRTRCAYCSFITRDATAQKANLSLYIASLIREIKGFSEFMNQQGKTFQAIYVGGGTPTALPEKEFSLLMQTIKAVIPAADNCEYTVEAGRPDSINREKLAAIQILPDVRICINPQTMHDRTLELIGRDHTVDQVVEAYKLAEKMGFGSINMDLILGLPGENGQDFLDSLQRIFELDPQSITIHSMALKRSAYLEEKYQQKYRQLRFPDQELAETFAAAIRQLEDKGYLPYYMYRQKNVRAGLENIGFAKAGHACRYNVGMMSDLISVAGLGSGSSTKIVRGSRVERLVNPKDLMVYADRIDEITQKKIAFFKS